MRLHAALVALVLATFSITVPAGADACRHAEFHACDYFSTITEFTSDSVDFRATHTEMNGIVEGGISHEDSWDAQMTVKGGGLSITCSGDVDRTRSSESQTGDVIHVVVDLTFGPIVCGHADLTFAVDNNEPPVVGVSVDGVSVTVEPVDVDGDLLPDFMVRAAASAELELGATVSGTIDSPIAHLPDDAVAKIKKKPAASTGTCGRPNLSPCP